jgi:hypothetical protein
VAQAVWDVVITNAAGAQYKQCAWDDLDPTCDYWFGKDTHLIAWRHGPVVTGDRIKFRYDFGAACSGHVRTSTAICLVTQYNGYTTGPGPLGGGENFGAEGIRLCDPAIASSCPAGSVPR